MNFFNRAALGWTVWIGLTDNDYEATYAWDDGTYPVYHNWLPGERFIHYLDTTSFIAMLFLKLVVPIFPPPSPLHPFQYSI